MLCHKWCLHWTNKRLSFGTPMDTNTSMWPREIRGRSRKYDENLLNRCQKPTENKVKSESFFWTLVFFSLISSLVWQSLRLGNLFSILANLAVSISKKSLHILQYSSMNRYITDNVIDHLVKKLDSLFYSQGYFNRENIGDDFTTWKSELHEYLIYEKNPTEEAAENFIVSIFSRASNCQRHLLCLNCPICRNLYKLYHSERTELHKSRNELYYKCLVSEIFIPFLTSSRKKSIFSGILIISYNMNLLTKSLWLIHWIWLLQVWNIIHHPYSIW